MKNKNILHQSVIKDHILEELVDVITCTNEDVREYCENHNIDIYEFIEIKKYVN